MIKRRIIKKKKVTRIIDPAVSTISTVNEGGGSGRLS